MKRIPEFSTMTFQTRRHEQSDTNYLLRCHTCTVAVHPTPSATGELWHAKVHVTNPKRDGNAAHMFRGLDRDRKQLFLPFGTRYSEKTYRSI